MKLHLLVGFSVVAVGCSSKSSDHATSTVVAPAATPALTSPPAAKPALPPDLAALAKGAPLQSGPFAWPSGGSSAVVGAPGEAKLIWKSGAEQGEAALPRDAQAGIVKDVDKAGEPELVIFAKAPTTALAWFDDATMAWIFGTGPTHKPARMWLLELKVMGATDEASLTRELGTLGTLGPTKDVSPVKVIARLGDATPAELQALVGKQGLSLCTRQGQKNSCKKVAQKAIDAKRAAQIVHQAGVVATYAPDPEGDTAEALQPPACEPDEKKPDLITCGASVGGPAGGTWVFTKSADGLRLVEVGSWAEDS